MKSKVILSIFLVFAILMTGMILPVNDDAKENAQVWNSAAITVIPDGWALPAKEGKPCNSHQICI